MPRHLVICLIILMISSFLFSGCATAPTKESGVDLNWEFIEIPGYPVRACLQSADVYKLKKALRECEQKSGQSR